MLPLHLRVLVAATSARVLPEGFALAVVLWAASVGDTTTAAVLVAATAFPQLVTGPLMGRALDRSTRREAWVAGCAVLAAAGCVVLALANLQLLASLVACAMLATTIPVLTGGMSSVMLGWSRDHSTLAAWDGTGYNVAGLVAPVLVTTVGAWRPAATMIALAAATLVTVGPMWLRGHGVDDPQVGAPPARPSVRAAARAIVGSRPLLVVTVTTTLFSLGLGGLELALVAAVQADGMPPARAGALATAIAVGALTGSLALTRVRRGPGAVGMTLAAVVVSGGLLVLLAGVGWPFTIPVAVAVGLADAPLLVGTYRARSEFAPPHLRSGVFTLGASVKLGAGSLGALLVGGVVAGGPTTLGLVVVGGLGIVASAVGAAMR